MLRQFDLPNSTSYFNFRLFANDSNLFHTFNRNERNINLADVSKSLQDVISWCNSNKLTININKTKFMIFKSRRRKVEIFGQLSINESVLESVNSISFLGICIDENITWRKHINNVCTVLSKK